MSTYLRGPVCGTDNCRSRLWRMIDGRRTCQYGHVMEGDIEFDEDVDAVSGGVITRRLNLTTNASGTFTSTQTLRQSQMSTQEVETKLYGNSGRILFIKSFQCVLRAQCKWLLEEKGFPKEYELVVKSIWMLYLSKLSKAVDIENVQSQDFPEDEDETGGGLAAGAGIKNQRRRLGLSMTSSIAILYLGCVHMGIPAFPNDFLHWICRIEMPYFRAGLIIPPAWRKQLPNYYLQLLDGGVAPHASQLYHKVGFVAMEVNFSTHFHNHIPYHHLVLRVLLKTVLPPEFYVQALALIELLNDQDSFAIPQHDILHYCRPHKYPELRAIAYFICAADLLLRSDLYSTEFVDAWLQHASVTGSGATEHIPTSLSCQNPSANLYTLDSEVTHSYLNWLESKFLPKYAEELNSSGSLDSKIAKRKLHNIVPLLSAPRSPKGSPSSDSKPADYLHRLQHAYDKLLTLSPDNSQPSPTHPTLLHKFKIKLIQDLSLEFGIASNHLIDAVDTIQRHCMKTLHTTKKDATGMDL